MFLILILMCLFLFPLLLINVILSWFKEYFNILYVVLVFITIPLRASLVFIYGVFYSILESLNYSGIDSLENPDDLLNI